MSIRKKLQESFLALQLNLERSYSDLTSLQSIEGSCATFTFAIILVIRAMLKGPMAHNSCFLHP